MNPALAVSILLLAATPTPRPDPVGPNDPPPPGVTQLLPRGVLAAVDDPEFVSAEASGLPDDAWVLGVVMDGEARAYDLTLLNRHEVVNDRIGETPYAAVW